MRWIFAVIFAASAATRPLAAREVPFPSPHVIASGAGSDIAFALFPADLDNDGDLDLLAGITLSGTDRLAWYANTDGDGSFGTRQDIGTFTDPVYHVLAADIDGDGDLDVLAASFENRIAWFENDPADSGAKGTFGTQQTITTDVDQPYEIATADVDGDGDLDVVSSSSLDSKIAWYENTDGEGTFGTQQTLSTGPLFPQSVFVGDVDGDGDVDVLAASVHDTLAEEINWYENTDGAGTFGSQQLIASSAAEPFIVIAADLDGDGDLDVASASLNDDKIAWYENSDGSGSFAGEQVISTLDDQPSSLWTADVDGDGDLDLLSSSFAGETIAWHENLGTDDGSGPCATVTSACFAPREVIATLSDIGLAVSAADVDGDGDVDAFSAARGDTPLAWHENETIHRSAAFPERSLISTYASGSYAVATGDLDGDGDLDVVSALTDRVVWHENSDGAGSFDGTFSGLKLITSDTDNTRSVQVADVDGDGDLDVLSASRNDNTIAWYENTDGEGTFGSQQVITSAAGTPNWVAVGDVDLDGEIDVLWAGSGAIDIAWHPNLGAGSFGSAQPIATDAAVSRAVFPADVDGDGDLDALYASAGGSKVAWAENVDGAGTFGPEQVISTDAAVAYHVFAADVDGDGDLDALSASRDDDKIAWYENTDGAGSFGPEQIITADPDGIGTQQGEADSARAVYAADLDGDGDLDVISASHTDNKIAWYENSDGAGGFGAQQVITSQAGEARLAIAADLDGDGDLDVVTASRGDSTTAWHPNRGGQFSLATTDVAQGVVALGELHDQLKIVLTHEGRAGDSGVELSSLELRFTDGSANPLTATTAAEQIAELRLYLDNGATPDLFEGSDTLVASTTDFSSIDTNGDGVLTWDLTDDVAELQVAHGTPRSYFVVAQLSGTTTAFDVEHRTESSSTGEDAPNDIPLILEFVANVQGGAVSTTLDSTTCHAPFDLRISERSVDDTVVCEAGTVLTTGADLLVLSSGDLTLRAGEAIEMGDGFEVQDGGDLTLDTDDTLQP